MLYPDFEELVAMGNQKVRIVHPASRSIKTSVSGGHRSHFRGHGLELDSVREYVAGDDIRSLDWRVTARTGSPHVKLFKEEKEKQIVICVDVNAAMRFGTKCTFKSVQAAKTAALLGWAGILQKDRVGFCLFGDVPGRVEFFTPERTKTSFALLLKKLTLPPEGHHKVGLQESLQHLCQQVKPGSLVYIISDFMDLKKEDVEAVPLACLRKKADIVFVQINDPIDRLIPPIGNLGLCAEKGKRLYINTESAAGRKAYAALWHDRESLLQQISTRWKIPLIALTTESDVRRDLLLELKTLVKGVRK